METPYPQVMRTLAARQLDAPVDRVAINQLTGDASTRAYFRAVAEGRTIIVSLYGEPFDESRRAIDCVLQMEATNPAARLTYASNPLAHIEATALFHEAGLPVPRILLTSGADGVMLFEDVGDLRLQDWLPGRAAEEVRDAYLEAVDLIVEIQNATSMALKAGSICAHMAFDEAKLRWELGFFFASFFNKLLKMKLDPQVANAVQADFKALCAELAARPRVLVHRDYHARNLMMHNGRMFIIDHQDARMGPASYDLASLISDPYAKLEPDLAGELIDSFIEKKSGSQQPLGDVRDFRRELRLMTVQRMLKAIGTYASQAATGNQTYIPYIEPARERALQAMRELNRFDATRALIERTLELTQGK